MRWAEEGETSSSYFLRLEKKRAVNWRISALRTSDGSLVSDKDGLCCVFRDFYFDLFSATSCDPVARGQLWSNVSSSLPLDQSYNCEGLLSESECLTALKGMARGKVPGCDGLPMEFYLRFWSVLGADLVCVLNSARSHGNLSCS